MNYAQLVCQFIIHCDKPAEGVKAFPENDRREWGPGPDLEAAGLLPVTHQEALIDTTDGTIEVRFKKTDETVNILHNLHSNNKTKDELKHSIVHYTDHKNQEIVMLVKLPDPGDYALNILAGNETTNGKYQNVCSYILSTENAASDQDMFPDLANGQIGSLGSKSGLHFQLLSHDSPFILCQDTGEIELVFESSLRCETITSLTLQVSNGNQKEQENLVWAKYKDRIITYKIRFPECGRYALKIFAKELGTDGSYSHVYTCVLHVTLPTENCLPFPSTFLQWKPDCDILEPTVKVLPTDSKIKFAAYVPNVLHLSVIDSNNKCTTMVKDKDNIWRAEVDTGNPGQLKLSGHFEKTSDTFNTLLSYTVCKSIFLIERISDSQLGNCWINQHKVLYIK